jgi:hypothetical protein
VSSVLLLECCQSVVRVSLHWCYSGVTVVSQECYSGLKVVLVVPLAGHVVRRRCLVHVVTVLVMVMLQWSYQGNFMIF